MGGFHHEKGVYEEGLPRLSGVGCPGKVGLPLAAIHCEHSDPERTPIAVGIHP